MCQSPKKRSEFQLVMIAARIIEEAPPVDIAPARRPRSPAQTGEAYALTVLGLDVAAATFPYPSPWGLKCRTCSLYCDKHRKNLLAVKFPFFLSSAFILKTAKPILCPPDGHCDVCRTASPSTGFVLALIAAPPEHPMREPSGPIAFETR